MPSKIKFYILWASHFFKQLICYWLGAAHDSYILQNRSLNSPFEKFETRTLQEIISYSDKEKDLESNLHGATAQVMRAFQNPNHSQDLAFDSELLLNGDQWSSDRIKRFRFRNS